MCASALPGVNVTHEIGIEINPIWGFNVIDVDKSKKPVTSACYHKQHLCTYLQPFSHCTSQ